MKSVSKDALEQLDSLYDWLEVSVRHFNEVYSEPPPSVSGASQHAITAGTEAKHIFDQAHQELCEIIVADFPEIEHFMKQLWSGLTHALEFVVSKSHNEEQKLQKRCRVLESKIKVLVEEITKGLNGGFAMSKAAIEQHKSEIDQLTTELTTLEKELVASKIEIEQLKPVADTVEPLQKQLVSTVEENLKLKETLVELQSETEMRVQQASVDAVNFKAEYERLQEVVDMYKAMEEKRNEAKKRREEEAQLERKNPMQDYIELLASQPEETWSELLISMGNSPEVPKLFRTTGKVRNKNLAKRETEKIVKEMWKDRMNDPAVIAGKAIDLVDFVCAFFQKKVGIMKAVNELGYNFLFSLWKYSWDADCELFLKIMLGDIKEEVYIAQIKLQEDVQDLFEALDKGGSNGSGLIPKHDVHVALASYFKVGLSSGKTVQRFRQLIDSLDKDQPGESVDWKKVFEEDREFNQGEFAECIRDQFLDERTEFFASLEESLAEEARYEDTCNQQQLAKALMNCDRDLSQEVALTLASTIFSRSDELLSITLVVKRLSKGLVRKLPKPSSITSSDGKRLSKASVVSGKAGVVPKILKPKNDGIIRALEAVRQEWVRKTLEVHQSVVTGATTDEDA